MNVLAAAPTRPPTEADDGRGVRALICAIAAVPVLVYLVVAAARVGYPYELEWMEGGSVELARRVAAGQPLYGPPTLEFTPWPYPPGYAALAALAAELVGPGFAALRWVSIVASLVVLAALVLILRQVSGRWLPGVVAAGVYAATYGPAGLSADVGRVDSVLVALVLLALLAAIRARAAAGGVLVAVILVAASATKQTAVPIALVMLAVLVWRRRRAGSVAAALYAGLLALGVGAADRWSLGWFVDYVVALLPGHPVVGHQFVTFWLVDLGLVLLPVVLLALFARFARFDRRTAGGGPSPGAGREPGLDLPVAVAAALVLVAWASRLHSGGAVNVLMTAYAGAALLVGLAVARLQGSRRGVVAVALALGAQVLVTLPSVRHAVPTAADRQAGDAVVAALTALPGRVLLPDHPYYLTLAGKTPAAHTVAISDVLRAGPSRARDALLARLGTGPSAELADVQVIVLDRDDDLALFNPQALTDFARVRLAPGAGTADPTVFSPVGGIPGRPSVVLLRRGVDVSGIDLRPLVAP
ncbi:MAG: glycosyltransferase family 39 protein [Austwickia sp.]|nr:glycosyltransferase family 39 protein [Austwickia sp.]